LRANLLQITESDGSTSIVDTYYRLNRNDSVANDINTTAPIIALVSDSFFVFQTGKKAHYETTQTWNELFSTKFPSIYSQLLQAYNGALVGK
jgi:hypothetical protein